MTTLGIGIIGCGGAAVDLCRAIDSIPRLRLVAAHDRNEASAAELALPRGGDVAGSIDALVGDPAVDIVYVALPHFLLAGAAEAALHVDKHVLVEKPLALTVTEVHRLDRLAEERNLRLGVFFELRESAVMRTARDLVAAGAIGAVRSVRIETLIDKPLSYWQSGYAGRSHDSWRAKRETAGGGVVLMNSIHQIDAMRFITGLEVTEISGVVGTLTAPVEVEDFAGAVFRLSNGAMGSLLANAHMSGAVEAECISLNGEHGRLDLPYPFSSRPLRLFLTRPWQGSERNVWLDIPPPRRDSFSAMLGGFVAAVEQGIAPPATAADAAAALGVVLGLYESSRTGRMVTPVR